MSFLPTDLPSNGNQRRDRAWDIPIGKETSSLKVRVRREEGENRAMMMTKTTMREREWHTELEKVRKKKKEENDICSRLREGPRLCLTADDLEKRENLLSILILVRTYRDSRVSCWTCNESGEEWGSTGCRGTAERNSRDERTFFFSFLYPSPFCPLREVERRKSKIIGYT